MLTAHDSHGTTLVRSRQGIELPGVGAWTIHTASFVGITRGSDATSQARVIDGAFTLGHELSEDGIWIELADHAGARRQLIAGSTSVGTTRDGFGRWHMVGTLSGERSPTRVAVTLDHRGVYRRGDRAYVWLTGTGRSDATVGRLRHRPALTLSFDLVAAAPPVQADVAN